MDPDFEKSVIAYMKQVKGSCSYMHYRGGEVWIGAGHKIGSLGEAIGLGFRMGKRLATKHEVIYDWCSVKLNRSAADFERLTQCRLGMWVIDRLIRQAAEKEVEQLTDFFGFDTWELRAQLVGCLIGVRQIREDAELIHAFKARNWQLASEVYRGPWKHEVRAALVAM
jgi:hypothetical protein